MKLFFIFKEKEKKTYMDVTDGKNFDRLNVIDWLNGLKSNLSHLSV